MTIQEAIKLGEEHLENGRRDQAEQVFRLVLQHAPDFPKALFLLAVIQQQRGRLQESVDLVRRAISKDQSNPVLHVHLAESLRRAGDFRQAERAAVRGIELAPQLPEPHLTQGLILQSLKKFPEAAAAIKRALDIDPTHGPALVALCDVLRLDGQVAKAIEIGRRAVELHPGHPVPHNNLANALEDNDQLELAESEYRAAIALNPNMPEALQNLGTVIFKRGDLDEAMNWWQRLLTIHPDHREAKLNLAFGHLAKGDWRSGWRLFEHRLDGSLYAPYQRAYPNIPVWDGSNLSDKTILLLSEQGYGDLIQYVRFVPMLAAQGATVLLSVPNELASLFRRVDGVGRVIAPGEPLPRFDTYCSLLGVPLRLDITPENMPQTVPYLTAEPALLEKWKNRIGLTDQIRVGLVWAGKPSYGHDRQRSISLDALQTLIDIPDVRFFSLQKGPAGIALSDIHYRERIVDLAPELTDFSQTAAAILNLDLIISVDTAVAHLSGALGVKTWTMIPFAADYRWMLKREDSPWYPTMRLFRQLRRDDWPEVIGRLHMELTRFVSLKKALE